MAPVVDQLLAFWHDPGALFMMMVAARRKTDQDSPVVLRAAVALVPTIMSFILGTASGAGGVLYVMNDRLYKSEVENQKIRGEISLLRATIDTVSMQLEALSKKLELRK